MSASDIYDLVLTGADAVSHGLICDWGRGGAGLSIDPSDSVKSTAVSTKGDFGVRDANDAFRIIQTDWSGGAGQTSYDRDADSANCYLSSKSIDVSQVGSLRLGPGMQQSIPVNGACRSGILAALTSGDPDYIPCVFRSHGVAPFMQYSFDNEAWTDVPITGQAPVEAIIDFCTDGEYVYAIDAAGDLFKGNLVTGFDVYLEGANLNKVAFASGILYASIGDENTAAKIGFLTDVPEWTQLSPAVESAINAAGVSFGLETSGNYVYWGVTNGMVTKVYKAMYAGGTANTDTLNAVATFPTGFVGACMYAYLGTVYVGGHYDGSEPTLGIGAIYAIVGDTPALLTNVGSDKQTDNRVTAMTSYEKALYFVSGVDIWRWDLVVGGYSHFAGPLSSGVLEESIPVPWDVDWGCSPAGQPATFTLGSNMARVSVGTAWDASTVLMFAATAGTSWPTPCSYALSFPCATSNATGTTLEFDLPTMLASGHSAQMTCGIADDVYAAGVTLFWSGHTLMGRITTDVTLNDPPWVGTQMGLFGPLDANVAHKFRLTLRGGKLAIYHNGVWVAGGYASIKGSMTQGLYATFKGWDKAACFALDAIRWHLGGAHKPGEMVTLAGVGLTAARDSVWASCTAGAVKRTTTDTYGWHTDGTTTVYGELVSSRSSGNMPTVDKFFTAINVQLENVLPTGSSIDVTGWIDGQSFGTVDESYAEDPTMRIHSIAGGGVKGRTISYVITITAPSTADGVCYITPVVQEVSVLFTPMPKTAKVYTYYVRVWDKVESRIPRVEWDEDATEVADWLESVANTVVTVERVGRSSYTGRMEGLQLIEAPPSKSANGREGLYQLTVRRLS